MCEGWFTRYIAGFMGCRKRRSVAAFAFKGIRSWNVIEKIRKEKKKKLFKEGWKIHILPSGVQTGIYVLAFVTMETPGKNL